MKTLTRPFDAGNRSNARLSMSLLVSDLLLVRGRRKYSMSSVVIFIICNALTALFRMSGALACYRKTHVSL